MLIICFISVSRNTRVFYCINIIFTKLRDSLINNLSKLNTIFSCTPDLWRGHTKTGYICVTMHYIDKD